MTRRKTKLTGKDYKALREKNRRMLKLARSLGIKPTKKERLAQWESLKLERIAEKDRRT